MNRLFAALIALLVALPAAAANRASVATGNWNQVGPTIWSTVCGGAAGSSVPDAGDDVTICNATTVTVSAAQAANTVIISAGGTLTFAGANTLTIDNSPPLTLNGGTFTAGGGTVVVNRDQAANVPVVSGTSAAITFNNLQISPTPGGARTCTLGAGSIATITINGDFDIIPANAGGAVRSLDVARGTVANLTVVGRTRVVALGAGNDSTSFTATGLTSFTSGRLELGDAAGGTGTNTLTASAVPITLNGTTGPLFTRNANGVFAQGTSTVTMSPTPATALALTSGTLTFNNFTVTNAGQTGTLGANTIVNTTLLVTAGTLSNGGFSLTGDGSGTFQVNDGATYAMTGTSVFPASFTTYTFQCGAYPSCSTVSYRQTTSPLTLTTQTYGHLDLAPAGAATQRFPAGAFTVNGNLIVGDGTNTTTADVATNSTTLDVNGGVTISANGTLTAHATNPFTVARNWTNNNAFTASGGTVTFDGGVAQTIGGTQPTTFNNLTIANTTGGVSLTASETVSGTLTLTSGTFSVGANLLTLNGPTIAGTPTNLSTTSSSNLLFGGTSAGVNLPSSVTSLNDLEVNNTNGLTLNSSPTLAGTLRLTSGVIGAGANTLTTSASCSTPSVIRTSGWVSGNLRMAFPAGTPNCIFHVGDAATNYTPLQLNFSSVGTAGSLIATTTSTDHPNTTAGTSGITSGVSINRYWVLKDSTMAGTATVTFNYIGGIPVDNDTVATPTRIRRASNCTGTGSTRTCAPWLPLTVSGSPTSTQAVASGVSIAVGATAQSDVVIGDVDTSTNFLRERQFIYTRELY